MRIDWQGYAVFAVGIASGLVTIVAAGLDRPWLAYAGAALIFVLLILLYRRRKSRTLAELRAGMQILGARLAEAGVKPEAVIAFDRSGGTFACMFATTLRIQHVLVLTRHRNKSATGGVVVGAGLTLNANAAELRFPLLVSFHVSTGDTLKAAIDYLAGQGISPVALVTLYVTPGARDRWPTLLYAFEEASNRDTLGRLPWIEGPYPYV